MPRDTLLDARGSVVVVQAERKDGRVPPRRRLNSSSGICESRIEGGCPPFQRKPPESLRRAFASDWTLQRMRSTALGYLRRAGAGALRNPSGSSPQTRQPCPGLASYHIPDRYARQTRPGAPYSRRRSRLPLWGSTRAFGVVTDRDFIATPISRR